MKYQVTRTFNFTNAQGDVQPEERITTIEASSQEEAIAQTEYVMENYSTVCSEIAVKVEEVPDAQTD